ncbi:uncharacterized protein LOC143469535 [Clavelina lepadiformis]|uniref:uncharacterized protein LOC143469535 n=1 Tax=Clavelina lepadiformis TaxID=159417 RepID=UPI00404229F0
MSTWFVLTDFSPLGRVTVEHLHNVFTCTAVSMFCAYIASYFHVMDFTTKQAHLSTFSSFPFGRNGVVLIINPIYEPPFYSSLSMFYAMIFVCYGYLTRRSTNIQRFSVVILMSFICGFGFRPTLGFLEVDHGTTSRVFRSASGGFLLLALGVQYF